MRRPAPAFAWRAVCATCTAIAPACDSRASSGASARGQGAATNTFAPATVPAASLRSVPTVPAPGCPALEGPRAAPPWLAGTVHAARVERDETWTAEGSPHEFPQGITIAPGASVSITPCTWLRFAPGTALRVSAMGALIVQGEAGRPVRFGPRGDVRPGAWDGVVFERGARPTSRLNAAIIEGGGGPGARAACLWSAAVSLDVTHLALERCRGHGVALDEGSAFRAQSDALAVRDVVPGEQGASGSAVWVRDADAVGTLPRLEVARSAIAAVEVATGSTDAVVTRSARWRDVGVPYLIAARDGLAVQGDEAPVLTLEPGVELRFAPRASFRVAVDAPAGLIARSGSSDRPILLTAEVGSTWSGLYVGPRADAANVQLEHVRILRAAGAAPEPLCASDDAGLPPDAAIHWMLPPRSESLSHVAVDELPTGAVALLAEWRSGDGAFGRDALEGGGANPDHGCRIGAHPGGDGGCFPAATCP